MINKFKEKAKIVGKILIVIYLLSYSYLLFFSDTYKFAYDFVKSNPKISSKIGNFKFAIPSFVNWGQSQTGLQGEAYYNILILGEKEGGKVSIRMTTINEVWTITEAVLITNRNEIVLLKDDK